MAGSKSVYLESALLAHVLGNTPYTAPGTLYAALSLSNFDATFTGGTLNEPTVGSYARVSITNNTTNFPAPLGGPPAVLSNGTAINFVTPTADWGLILAIYLLDAATVGNALYGADLTAPVSMTTGSSLSVPTTAFVFQET